MTTEQQRPTVTHLTFDLDFVQQLASYLASKPYVEVFQLITKIQEVAQASAQGMLNLGSEDENESA